MRTKLEREFFPFVMKPGRYVGGEPGQIVKSAKNRTSLLYSYPDKYEIAMSYVGLQSLYHIINSDDRFLCERVFSLDIDAEERLRSLELPLFSIESSRPATEFDLFGFTLVDETVYTNVLTLLDLAGIPLRSNKRTDDQPLIIAGGPGVFNPEPLAPFVDLFFIGDAEEGLPQILETVHEMPNSSRMEKLEAIVRSVKSVYVPVFYDDNCEPVVDFAPEEIHARVLPTLKPHYYPEQPLVPLIDTVHNHLSVEIMRGCPQGCRFCMAGSIYRPVRPRPQEEILRQAELQLQNSGYPEVTLLSLSSSDYPEIEKLAATLARRLEPQRISLSLPSLRPGTISPKLLDAIGRVRKSGFTIAPEAGTERLRLFLRKDFPDAAIYDTVRLALKKGWRTIKLYFMLGLPSETEEDLTGIARICGEVYSIAREFEGRVSVNVTLSAFSPKAHTPLQWDEIVPEEEIFRRINSIKKQSRGSQVHYKYSDTRLSMVVSLIGRGDRKIADVIEKAFESGCRFDGWSEQFNFDLWCKAFEDASVDMIDLLSAIPFSARLPWSHIRKGVSIDKLKSERERTSLSLKEYAPMSEPLEAGVSPESSMSFGRGKKKVPSRNQMAPNKNLWRINWGRDERMRYLSHLDNLRIFERSIRKANIPITYSQGFNPSMKLSFGPPLSLGFTSEAEYVDILLESTLYPEMIDNLNKALPIGMRIIDMTAVIDRKKSLSALLNRALYTLDLSYWESKSELENALQNLLQKDSLIIERTGKKGIKSVDIRPGIFGLMIEDGRLVMELGMSEGLFVRPLELIDQLTKQPMIATIALPVHRKATYRLEDDNTRINPMEL